jgi:hypothetical protein
MRETASESLENKNSIEEFLSDPPKGFMPTMSGLVAVDLVTVAVQAADIIDKAVIRKVALSEIVLAIGITAGAYIKSRNSDST